jgi:hypothetical protein
VRDYDWNLIQRLGRKSQIPSDDERADGEVTRIVREQSPNSPIVAWTISAAWTDAHDYANSEHRGRIYTKDRNGYEVRSGLAVSGEINPSR